jgi:nicotinate-nucleotide--dimethylbenzimidazole phosphoribosyltransferase
VLALPELAGQVVVVDCVTLWLTNLLGDAGFDPDRTLAAAQSGIDAALGQETHWIFVSNEVGMSVHAPTEVGRKFTDLQGFVNQYLASRVDAVCLMVAGIPTTLKGAAPTPTARPALPEPSAEARTLAEQRQTELTKPPGSLGRLEGLAVQIAAWQSSPLPQTRPVTRHGVSPYPSAVTRAMLDNFVAGGAAASVLSAAHGIPLRVVDVGVANGVTEPVERGHTTLERDPVCDRPGGDLRTEDAMDPETFEAAVTAGRAAVQRLPRDLSCLILGEMGIGNSTAAAAVCAALIGGDPDTLVGAGTGSHGQALERKRQVVRDALGRAGRDLGPREALRRLGGRELAALYGAIQQALERRVVVVIDGFIVTAAALPLLLEHPEARAGLVFAHRSDEQGHARVLDTLGVRPLLDLGMRLGEGSGALVAFPLLEQACRLHRSMATFASAEIPHRTDPGA